MKKIFIILFLIFTSVSKIYTQTGIGTTAPVNKFEVVNTTANPATSGATANGHLRLGATSGDHVLDFGLSSSSTYSWLQARNKTGYGTYYKLALNPNGGPVGIGTASPSSTLTVGNEGGTVGGEILLNPTTVQYEGGQIIIKKSLIGSTVDWTIDQYGTTSSNARFRIFNGVSENNGLSILENGNIGFGTAVPTARLNIVGGGVRIFSGFGNSTSRPNLNTSSIGNYEIRGVSAGGGSSQDDAANDGFLRLSAGGGTNSNSQSSIDISGYSSNTDMNSNITMRTAGAERLRIDNTGNVGIGTTTPVDRLDVRSAMSVNEIKFRGTDGGDDSDPYRLRKFKIGDLNELQLHLNDDWNERFAIYGNSCLTSGCPEYSVHLYHYFRSDGSAYHAGKVGIGTTSPEAPLHVASSASIYATSFGFLNSAGAGSGTSNNYTNYSILANERIRASEFNAISDARIKRGINLLNTQKQLSELNKLQVVNYQYIDQLVNGAKIKTGFIAQEVEKVNYQFVNQSADFIPSVFAVPDSVMLNDNVLKVATDKPHGFIKGEQVKFFIEGKKEEIKTIEEILSPKVFTVKGWDAPTDNLFVYGKKVSDFRAIDFDQITALSVAAIQELSKQIESLKSENDNLKNILNKKVEAKQLELEKRLLKLEGKLN
jgi:hypothetical protein